jgi:hypothetical protein
LTLGELRRLLPWLINVMSGRYPMLVATNAGRVGTARLDRHAAPRTFIHCVGASTRRERMRRERMRQ